MDTPKEIFVSPPTDGSFTITKRLCLVDSAGEYLGLVKNSLVQDMKTPHLMGKITALLYEKFMLLTANTMVSMDNCSHSGDKLFAAIEAWTALDRERIRLKGILDYIRDKNRVSFPGYDR